MLHFLSQNQKVALTNQEIMKIAPALLSIGSNHLACLQGRGTLITSCPKPSISLTLRALGTCCIAMPFIKKDLDHHKLAISQQCGADTLILHDSAEYLTAFEAWRSKRGAASRTGLSEWKALEECSVDSKTFASHGSLLGEHVQKCWQTLISLHLLGHL